MHLYNLYKIAIISAVISLAMSSLGIEHRLKMDAHSPSFTVEARAAIKNFKAGSQGDAMAVTQPASQPAVFLQPRSIWIKMLSVFPAWFKREPSKDRLNHADVQYAAEPCVPYLTKTSLSDETHGKSAERERERERD